MASLFTYSPELRQRLITYLKESKDLDITDEQANEYLDSLASLYDWFARDRL